MQTLSKIEIQKKCTIFEKLNIMLSKTILSFQKKLIESDLSPSTKVNLIQQSLKMKNTLKYQK